jgi:hypothetical protein
MKRPILTSEHFGATDRRHYFIDLKLAHNQTHFLQFTRSELQPDGSYKRWPFVVFEEHMGDFLITVYAMLDAVALVNRQFIAVRDMGNPHLRMKDLPETERPREKLAASGVVSLSDAELLAILLGSGSLRTSALDLAHSILDFHGSAGLKSVSLGGLCRFTGMGVAKSSVVLAAVELGRRIYG